MKKKIVYILLVWFIYLTGTIVKINSNFPLCDDLNSGESDHLLTASTYETITGEFQINHYTAGSPINPSICALSNENFVAAWCGAGKGDGNGVYANIFNAVTGENITSEFRLNQHTAGSQNNPSICALSNEKFAATWNGAGPGDGTGVYARIFSAITGESLTAEFQVNQHTARSQQDPRICALSPIPSSTFSKWIR